MRTLLAAVFLTFMGQCTLTDHSFRIQFTELDSSQFAQRTDPGVAVARSDRELAALWEAAGLRTEPPSVDFRRDMVVAYFMGGRSSAGYTTRITAVTVDGMRLVVDVENLSPGDRCATATVMTSPVDLVLTTRQGAVPWLGRLESTKVDCGG